MITGYKKKKLGHPSEKLSGDVPRASWHAVIFSEVVFPVVMAILFTIAYTFVKSFPVDGETPPSPLVRIAVISLGPIVWNAAILLTLFLISLFLGPMLDPLFPLFGSVMAFTAHLLGAVGMVGFFEFLVSITSITDDLGTDVSILVVPRIVECFTCRIGSDHCHIDSARSAQNSHICLLVSRVQA